MCAVNSDKSRRRWEGEKQGRHPHNEVRGWKERETGEDKGEPGRQRPNGRLPLPCRCRHPFSRTPCRSLHTNCFHTFYIAHNTCTPQTCARVMNMGVHRPHPLAYPTQLRLAPTMIICLVSYMHVASSGSVEW